jgi:hypothetical protein
MASGLIEKEVDGLKYEFEKWGAEESFETLLKLTKLAGKPLGMALASFVGDKGMDQDVSPDLLAMAFEGLTGNMDEKVCMSLMKKLTSEKVFCNGAKVSNFSVHYQDRLMHLLKVAKAALEVQYGNFFEELLGLKSTAVRITNQGPLT